MAALAPMLAIGMMFPTASQANEPGEPARQPSAEHPHQPARALPGESEIPLSCRLLFLDDDPARADVFLKENPLAVWVQTVPECLGQLVENWHEVHLDHDLGGKTFVDMNENDCGMEVIRWLCTQPRDHLRETRFFIHTHNSLAGLLMVLQMRSNGYKAEFRPFGLDPARLLRDDDDDPDLNTPPDPGRPPHQRPAGKWRRWIELLKGCWTSLQRHAP